MASVFTLFTSQRFFVYETQFQATLVIIEQGRSSQEISSKDGNAPPEWETKKEIVIPNVVYSRLNKMTSAPQKSILERKRKVDFVDWDSDENWDVEHIHRCDLSLLPMTIKVILCKHDCSMVPITQNQLGVWREIEALENFWGVERDPSSPPQQQPLSPEAGNVTQEEDVDVGDELNVPTIIVTPEGDRFCFESAATSEKDKKRTKTVSKKPNLTNLFVHLRILTRVGIFFI